MRPPAAPSQNNKATPSVADHRRDAAVGRGGRAIRSPRIFAAGDTITVNGNVITFVAAGALPATSSTSPTISTTLLAKIDSITGTAHPSDHLRRRHHAAFRHGCPNLSVTSSNSQRICRARLHRHRDRDARRRRHGRHRAGDRQRQLDVPRQIRRRRRGHHLRRVGRAGEPAVSLGQDRQRLARRRSHRHLEPVLSGQCQRHRHQVAWQNVIVRRSSPRASRSIASPAPTSPS